LRYETIPALSVWIGDSSTLSSRGRVAAMKTMFESGNPGKVPLIPRPADLKPIDDLIALYEKPRSVMAKRNIVVYLSRAIAGWRRLHPGPTRRFYLCNRGATGRGRQSFASQPVHFEIHVDEVTCCGLVDTEIARSHSTGTC